MLALHSVEPLSAAVPKEMKPIYSGLSISGAGPSQPENFISCLSP